MNHRRDSETSPYGPFRMGIQSYSLRHFAFDQALKHTQSLRLGFWESFPAHTPITEVPEQLREYKSKLKAAGVQLVAFGVLSFDRDQQAARRAFEFARAMGIETLTADPSPDSFEYLAKLAAEYKIPIAIHNHGPGSRYDKIEQVQAVLKDQPKPIGVCVDTGHFLRSGEDPVEAIHLFGSRVYAVHLKDVRARTQFTELGKGDLDLVGTLKALQKVHFKGCLALEYEEHPENPIPYIQECLLALQEAVKRL